MKNTPQTSLCLNMLQVQVDFDKEHLVEMEVSNEYDWVQNQISINEQANDQIVNPEETIANDYDWGQNQFSSSEQANEFVNSFPDFNYEIYPKEIFGNAENEGISNLQPSNLENYVADYANQQVRTLVRKFF